MNNRLDMAFRKIHAILNFLDGRHSKMIKTTAGVILISTLVLVLFIHSVKIREPWMGTLYSPHHINSTAFTLLFAQNWYNEGAINLRFASVAAVNSVEKEGTDHFPFYVSWPPGHLVPVHLIALLTGNPPSPVSIMKLNLFNHLISSLLLALGTFYLLLQAGIRRNTAALLALIPPTIFLFSVGTLWFMQVVYHGPQAVIPLFVLYLFLEVLRRDIQKLNYRRIVVISQFLVVFVGVLTDYLFYFVVLVAFIIRLVNREISVKLKLFIRQSLIFWSPVILGSLLYLGQLLYLDALPQLISRGMFRAGSSGGVDFFVTKFWNNHLNISFGQIGRGLILASIALLVAFLIGTALYRICKKRPIDPIANRAISIASMALFPPLMQVFVLKNWCAGHLFTALSFAVPLAFFPVLVCLHLRYFRKQGNFFSKGLPVIIALIFFALAGGYAATEKNRMTVLFTPQSTAAASARHEKIYRLIGKHTGYEDVVFSPHLEVSNANKIPLILSGKNIYKLFSVHDIFYRVRDINQEFGVCVVIDRRYEMPSWFIPLIKDATVTRDEEWELYKMDGREFLDAYKRGTHADINNAYFHERQEYERLRGKMNRHLDYHDFEGALTPLQGILRFLEKHQALAANSRYLITEMAILNILKRSEQADARLDRLRRLSILPARHPIWGWDSEPSTLKPIMRDHKAQKIIRGKL